MIARLSSLWLQQKVRCDCKTKSMHSVFATYFVCVITNTAGYFMIEKSLNQCVFATILRAWLQPEVNCGCNMTVSVWLKLLGYLVIYDCKSE
jgi:hypothetical protein